MTSCISSRRDYGSGTSSRAVWSSLRGAPVAMAPRRTLVVDGSVVEGAASLEEASLVAWRVASAAARHEADEVVVLRAASSSSPPPASAVAARARPPARGQGAAFLARLLQFFETPPYLRRALIPRHPDLAMVGALPRHHPPRPRRACAPCPTTSKSTKASPPRGRGGSRKNPVRSGTSTLADVGLGTPVALDRAVKVGVRVTVELPDEPPTTRENRRRRGLPPRYPAPTDIGDSTCASRTPPRTTPRERRTRTRVCEFASSRRHDDRARERGNASEPRARSTVVARERHPCIAAS